MDPIMGQIVLFALQFVPANWAACNGAVLPIASNMALFSLIGTKFGGDGTKTFALPKMADVDGVPYFICVSGIFPSHP